MPRGLLVLTVVLLGLCFGCTRYTVNQPLTQVDPNGGYRLQGSSGDADDSQELLLVLTFSGGGTRAAAFSYGILEALRDIKIEFDGQSRSLLDEIDIISGVSGGSVTAAYYGLYGKKKFDDFPEAFLYRNVQGKLTRRFLAPWNWFRLASPYYGRSDMMAEYFDQVMFNGKTFDDLKQANGPFVVINATDVSIGSRFGFDQDQFDLLCSDLSSFPVSRAVAASSSVPILLSPVTVRNYPSADCSYQPPGWVSDVLGTGEVSSRRYQEASRIMRYVRPGDTRYVHLLDGGLSDNLGLRATMDKATFAGGYVGLVKLTGFRRFRRVAHIVINAQKESGGTWSKTEQAPGIFRTILAAPTVTLNRYNFETVESFRQDRTTWMDELREFRCSEDETWSDSNRCEDLQAHFVEISFAQHNDADEREFLNSLPTSFRLEPDSVDRVRDAAALLLNQSNDFQIFLNSLKDLKD